MLKSFIGADMRLYERFGVGLHNNPDAEVNSVNPTSRQSLKARQILGLTDLGNS